MVQRPGTSLTPGDDLEPTVGLCEAHLEARDLDRMEAFYTRCFGLEVLSREEDRVWLACGRRARLGLWAPRPKEFGDEGGRHVHFAFGRARRPRVQPRAPARSRRLADRPRRAHGRRSVDLRRGPEGNVVEVWDYFEAGDGRAVGVAGLEP